MRKRVRDGFSMIELLVVIAVIGILAGILLPVLGKMREKGKVAATMALIKNLEVALRQYDFDFGQYPPDPAAATAGDIDASYNLGAECLVYYLGTPFRKLPTRANHVKATKNGGPYFEFKHEYLMNTDPGSDENMEIVDYWGTPIEYDNIRDDPTGFTDCSTFASDPREGEAKNPNSYDVWSLGISKGGLKRDIIGNFKP